VQIDWLNPVDQPILSEGKVVKMRAATKAVKMSTTSRMGAGCLGAYWTFPVLPVSKTVSVLK